MKKNNIIIVDNNNNKNINIFNEQIEDLQITVKDNSSLKINYFVNINNSDSKININVGTNSRVEFNYSYINKEKYKLDLSAEYVGFQSSIVVNINGLNIGGLSEINVDGIVAKEKANNVLDEKIKVLNVNNGKTICKPNMYISTNKVIANHENAIGNINEDELFYLMSKGLSKDKSKKLICYGFILNVIDDDNLRNQIKEYLKWR